MIPVNLPSKLNIRSTKVLCEGDAEPVKLSFFIEQNDYFGDEILDLVDDLLRDGFHNAKGGQFDVVRVTLVSWGTSYAIAA